MLRRMQGARTGRDLPGIGLPLFGLVFARHERDANQLLERGVVLFLHRRVFEGFGDGFSRMCAMGIGDGFGLLGLDRPTGYFGSLEFSVSLRVPVMDSASSESTVLRAAVATAAASPALTMAFSAAA